MTQDDIKTALADLSGSIAQLGATVSQNAATSTDLNQKVAAEAAQIHELVLSYSDRFASGQTQSAGELSDFLESVKASTQKIRDITVEAQTSNATLENAGAQIVALVPSSATATTTTPTENGVETTAPVLDSGPVGTPIVDATAATLATAPTGTPAPATTTETPTMTDTTDSSPASPTDVGTPSESSAPDSQAPASDSAPDSNSSSGA